MKLDLAVQKITLSATPSTADFKKWIIQTLNIIAPEKHEAELTVRLVDDAEIAALNQRYRHKSGATNVLSFPAQLPPGIDLPILGDIVICAPLVHKEAETQKKPIQAHFTHLTVHGVLHLLGYDHENDEEATVMENLEINILNQLGLDNPYHETTGEEEIQ
jgi:probable rRNA maturation factor